ncbi:glycosyltransferase involved in cell wall biosynthesis [Mariniflexile fucanivorans]|uniref:Glycosyltransferase involved in cell wall biosynthesis n=1 Tax=Mariniflexile fucanivorans TaxID=264023 RepID=A0A4R1RKI8_9FLAO|nr:glycosyltransferase family 2 protein [Mariniflexile fucanivorans]TCL66705.1 glycosyltransferase involved in cell wall biosynthesis [Mariniflexile fucanivorans]
MFSIGIPAYKAKDLKECIDSILIQTYKDFELIIVNDCSPEPIDEIVSQYDDLRIRYYKNEKNFGAEHVVDNWNKCLSFAKGEYFVLMGDDDKMEAEYLEEFVRLVNNYPTLDVWHCRSIIIDGDSKPIRLTPNNPEYEDVYDYIINCFGEREQFISDFVYRTAALNLNGGYCKLPLAWCSDYLTSFVLAQKQGIAHTNKLIFNYRSHSTSITSTGNLELKFEAMDLYIDWIKKFLSNEPNNEYLLLKHQMIKNLLNKFIIRERQDEIRTAFGKRNLYQGFLKYFQIKRKYNLSISDLIGSIAASFYFRSLRK